MYPTIGTEMAKTRPGVIVSNYHANRGSNRVSVVPITLSNIAKVYPFEVFLPAKSETGLRYVPVQERDASFNKCIITTEIQHENKTLYWYLLF